MFVLLDYLPINGKNIYTITILSRMKFIHVDSQYLGIGQFLIFPQDRNSGIL